MVDAAELVEFASDAAFVVDGLQIVLAWNAPAEALLGYTAKEALGRTCAEMLQAVLPDGGKLCYEKCEGIRGFHTCMPYSAADCHALRKDGSRVAVEIASIAVPTPRDGAADGPVAIIFVRRQPSGVAPVDTPTDPRLQIHTLGRFAVSVRGCCLPLEQWPRKQAIQLLKFLSFHAGRPVHRERLVEHLWPDVEPELGWSRLKVTIFFLRQRLREAGLLHDVVATVDSSYLLRSERISIDSAAFEALAREGMEHQRAGRVAEAIHAFEDARRLYRGDYLEADLYKDWCAEERERIFEIYLDLLSRLAEVYSARGDHAAAAQVCHTALVREPCRENIHRLLIRSLIALNRPDRAVAQYRRCRQILRSEIGVEPSPETSALVAHFSEQAV